MSEYRGYTIEPDPNKIIIRLQSGSEAAPRYVASNKKGDTFRGSSEEELRKKIDEKLDRYPTKKEALPRDSAIAIDASATQVEADEQPKHIPKNKKE